MEWWKRLFGKITHEKESGTREINKTPSSLDENPQNLHDTCNTAAVVTKSRNIRIFISSTFEDMKEEREVLVKKIFPQLRNICMERGVGFTEVDLRWGVTQEQVERGEVLPVCLAEIENSRPYFIGLLGERYGWIPDVIPQAMIDKQPWLAEHRQRSITELEIIHGVLLNPEMTGHAFFYFRAPSASDTRPENSASSLKLKRLKERILKSGFPVHQDYPDAETAGQLVLNDLSEVIDQQYPKQKLTQAERNRLDHKTFAENRSKVFIGRHGLLKQLDEHVEGTGKPLVILGESGSGKSALLANWGIRFAEKHPETFLVMHFIGSGSDSSDHAAILQRMMMEIKEQYTLEKEIPETPQALRAQFPQWLELAAASGPMVIVIDALNQLEDKDNAPDLLWLPEVVPDQVKMIVSTLPGRSLNELRKRGWATRDLELFELDERRQFIQEYLFQLYSKRLPDDLVDRIALHKHCANPLFLHALLEELRIFGEHHKLQEKIDHYLKADDIEDLYQLILTRLEDDYEREFPGMVGEALSLLWAARRGLSESELLAMMNLPRLAWSPLFLALQESLIARSGLLTFFHDYLRQAVYGKYIKSTQAEQETHLRIAKYFEAVDADHPFAGLGNAENIYRTSFHVFNRRVLEELPWQLARARDWQMLQKCLADLPFLKAVFLNHKFEVMRYWQELEAHSEFTCRKAYQNVLDSPGQFSMYLPVIEELFSLRGDVKEALQMAEDQVKNYNAGGYSENPALRALGYSEKSIQELNAFERHFKNLDDEAAAADREQEKQGRIIKNLVELERSLNNQGHGLLNLGDLDGALKSFQELEKISREYGHKFSLQVSLGGQGNVYNDLGKLDRAMELYREQERICRELENGKNSLWACLGNQGTILRAQNDLDGAMKLYKEQEKISKEIGDVHAMMISSNNQGDILLEQGNLDGAMNLFKEQEKSSREIGDKSVLQLSLGNQGIVFSKLGNPDDALARFNEQEKICRDIGDKKYLQKSLFDQAGILMIRGNVDAAMPLLQEQEKICRDLKNQQGLQASFAYQGLIQENLGNLENALTLYKKQEQICRELGDKKYLQISLGNQGNVLRKLKDPDTALILYKEQEQLCRELKDGEQLHKSLGNQGAILKTRGDIDGSLKLYREQESICRNLQDKDALHKNLNTQGLILMGKKEQKGALTCYTEQEQICSELHDKKHLQAALWGQGAVFMMSGNLDKALKLFKEQERVCREINDTESLHLSLQSQTLVMNELGRKQ